MNSLILSSVKKALINALELDNNHPMELDTSLKNDLGIDSISSMDFLMHLEDNIPGFVVNADTLEVGHFKSIRTIARYVETELMRVGQLPVATATTR